MTNRLEVVIDDTHSYTVILPRTRIEADSISIAPDALSLSQGEAVLEDALLHLDAPSEYRWSVTSRNTSYGTVAEIDLEQVEK